MKQELFTLDVEELGISESQKNDFLNGGIKSLSGEQLAKIPDKLYDRELSSWQKHALVIEGSLRLGKVDGSDEPGYSFSLDKNSNVVATYYTGEVNVLKAADVGFNSPEVISKGRKNLSFLVNGLKYSGLDSPEVVAKLKEKVKGDEKEFVIPLEKVFGGRDVHFGLNFSRSDKGFVFFNSFDGEIKDNKSFRFYLNRGEKSLTAKEAFNLLEGRSVFRPKIATKSGQSYSAWTQIEFDGDGKGKMNTYGRNYGFDLDRSLDRLNLDKVEFNSRVKDSLLRGNRQAVVIKDERYFVEASPKYKNLNVYSKDGKLVLDFGRSQEKKELVAEAEKHESKVVVKSKKKKHKAIKMKL